MKNKKILQNHKKVGSKFIPSFLVSKEGWETKFIGVDLSQDILSEIIWIQYLNDFYDVEYSAELVHDFINYIENVYFSDSKLMYGFISNLDALSDFEISNIRNQIVDYYWYHDLRLGLEKFNQILPFNPLNKFFLEIPKKDNNNIEYLKNTLLKLSSKNNREYVLCVTNLMLVYNKIGRLMISENINIAQPKEILNYPKTDESLKLASFMRSMIHGLIKNENFNHYKNWNKNFWNYIVEYEPLEIVNLISNER